MRFSFKVLLSAGMVSYLLYHPLYAMMPGQEDPSKTPSVKAAATAAHRQPTGADESVPAASQAQALIAAPACTALALPLPSLRELLPAQFVPAPQRMPSAASYNLNPLVSHRPSASEPPVFSAVQESDWEERAWANRSGVDEKYQPSLQGHFYSPALAVGSAGAAAAAAAAAAPFPSSGRYASPPLEDSHRRAREAPSQRQGIDFRLGKFKFGAEFQEISGLCPWALRDYNVQKKPLFSIRLRSSNRKLWELVLDTSDIEFVTNPFADNERELLGQCIHTTLASLNSLQALLDVGPVATFATWTTEIGKLLPPIYSLTYDPTYKLIHDKNLARPSFPWRPRFSPQVTIQHPLEYTIPLYFGLFGFSSEYMPFFSASLPFREDFLKAQEDADSELFERFIHGYQQKINGLVFLHALTLVRMGMTSSEDTTDAELLNETNQLLSSTSQVDAKTKLILMSRRPFSAMFREIRLNADLPDNFGNYFNYFMNVMGANSSFRRISSQFNKTNYAEQFFDLQARAERSLIGFLPCFREPFLSDNRPMLKSLLEVGVISTTMLRNFRDDVRVNDPHNLYKGNSCAVVDLFKHNQLFNNAVYSVESPSATFRIDSEHMRVQAVPSKFDSLSPPYFLLPDNSMGWFNGENADHEREYGEAIIEVRSISKVQAWFLKKCGLDPELEGEFLKRPSLDKGWREIYNLFSPSKQREVLPSKLIGVVLSFYRDLNSDFENQALCLFDFLNNFGKDPRHVREIYYMGMPVGLKVKVPGIRD